MCRKSAMSLFQKILDEKLKKQDKQFVESPKPADKSSVSSDLLRWLNTSQLSKTYHFKVETSTYSHYSKTQEEILERRNRKELERFSVLISGISDKKSRQAAQFFFDQGARRFMDGTVLSLKKDYRSLAFRLHPDRNIGVSDSNKSQSSSDFHSLSESYQKLILLFSRANKAN